MALIGWLDHHAKSTAWPETDNSLEQEFSPAYQHLERRLGWLRELAGSLEGARAAVLANNLAELKLQTARQRDLCAALGQFELGTPIGVGERWNRLLQESAKTEIQVRQLNREYGALLARARRTVDIFCRLLANSEPTYLPPKRESGSFPKGLGS